MEKHAQMSTTVADETVRVSLIVKDDRGFTHYYEEVVTTPAAVRDAFDLMVKAAPTTNDRAPLRAI